MDGQVCVCVCVHALFLVTNDVKLFDRFRFEQEMAEDKKRFMETANLDWKVVSIQNIGVMKWQGRVQEGRMAIFLTNSMN